MKSVRSYGKYVTLAAIMVIALSAMAFANGARVTPSPPTGAMTTQPGVSQPAMVGAGATMPMAFGSSVGNTAYLYTGNIRTTTPMATTGSMQMSVVDTSMMQNAGPDRANVVGTFMYPATGGSQYRVEFTSVDTGSDFGGVGILKPVFGQSGACAGYNLPATTAYAVAIGNATITKDGNTIATNVPALAAVTQALHDDDQTWLSMADPERQEIHLIVPGSMVAGGTAIEGFPNGGFYVYWPSAAVDLRNVGGVVQMAPGVAVPGTVGRGPDQIGFEEPIGTISMSITNDGIRKAVGTAPAGPYIVQVMNNSSRSRGLVMTGTDLAGNEFVRYTNILQPGQSTQFQYFFAPGKVVIRDFLSGQRTATAYTNINLGPLSSSIVFQ